MNKKKILILGGINFACEIVDEAHKLGLEVYVTDYNADSPAKALADHSFMVSATDVDGVVQLIKEHKIDGVLFGYADVLMSSYVDICQQAGLPCYTTHDLNKLTLDKKYFKNRCEQYGIPTIKEYSFDDIEQDKIVFPVIVKPIDNSGARGIFICRNKSELLEFYNESLAYSKNKSVIIEQYCDSPEATAFYYAHHGKVCLLGFADRHMLQYNDKNLPLPIGYTFPSSKYDILKEELEITIVEMLEQEGMKEGFMFIQGFIHNNTFIPYESGYRLTASMEHHLFEHNYGFNHISALVQYAVGLEVDDKLIEQIDPTCGHYANVTLLLNKGTISQYVGIDDVQNHPNVLHTFVSYPIGTTITDQQYGKLSQVGIRVLLYAENIGSLISLMDYVKNALIVLDEKGQNMLITSYSYISIPQN